MINHRLFRYAAFVLVAGNVLLAGAFVHAQEDKKGDQKPSGPPPATVRIGVATTQELANHFSVVGRLMELRSTSVAVETAGRVVEVNAEQGDQVTSGKTVLAKIDDTWAKINLQDAQAQIAQANASIQSAKAELEQSQRDLTYLDDLLKAGSAKPKEVADKRTDVASNLAKHAAAQANLNVAQAGLSRAQTSIERLEVFAPFDGVVIMKLTEVGQWLDQGDEVATIISRGEIDAVVDVPEDVVTALTIGQDIEIYIAAIKKEVNGKIIAIVPQAATGARTFPVKIRLEDMQGKLKPGMSVVASLPLSEKSQVLTVPRDAVETNVQGSRVWVAMTMPGSPMPAAMPVPVRVLFGSKGRYAVAPIAPKSPLQADTKVVVEGAERLFPTQPLIFLPDDAPAKANPNTPAAATTPAADKAAAAKP